MTHYAPLVALIATLLALTSILTVGRRAVVHDIPNERSLHARPMLRVGGIGLMIGIAAGWMLQSPFWSWWIVLPVLGLFALSPEWTEAPSMADAQVRADSRNGCRNIGPTTPFR